MDEATLTRLLAEDVHWEHHNHFAGDGRDGLVESIRRIGKLIPGRAFAEPTRVTEVGDMVYREHKWTGTPTEAFEGFDWKPGVPASLEALSVFVFQDGRIAEWSDYG